jgi:hypothetical protein
VALHPPSSAAEHTSVTMRPPQVIPAPARSLPGPFAMGVRGPQGPVAETRSERAGGVGLAGPSKPAGLPPPPGTAFGGPQSGRATSSAALAPPGHPGVASPQGGGAVTPQSLAGQVKNLAWPDAAHSNVPAQAFHPQAQAFHPPAPASHPPVQGSQAQASHPRYFWLQRRYAV